MTLAHHIATWSKEHGRRVGAVIIGDKKEVRSTGFNGFPRGVDDDVAARHSAQDGSKYKWSCHAEQNAIFNAARIGIPLEGCTIYIPWFPCVDCTKSIIQSGINEVVAYEPLDNEPRWALDFGIAAEMLHEAGVKVRFIAPLMPLPIGQAEEKAL